MTPYELLDLILAAQNRGDVQWGLFITVHLALLGGIIYVDRPLRRREKFAVFLIYVGFAYINYTILNSIINQIAGLHADLARLAVQSCCKDSLAVKHALVEIEAGRFARSSILLNISHIAMAVVVGLSIIFDRALASIKN